MVDDDSQNFPGILPDEVHMSKYHVIENNDIPTEAALKELILLIFNHPERDFYFYAEKDARPNQVLIEAQRSGAILMDKIEFYYYRHPKAVRNFVKIPRDGGQFEWEKALARQGPMFQRIKLELTAQMKRQLEVCDKIEIEKNINAFPIELKPTFFGIGLDIQKSVRYLKRLFRKK